MDRQASILLQLLATVNFLGVDYKVYLQINRKLEARLFYCGKINVPVKIRKSALWSGQSLRRAPLLLVKATVFLLGEQGNMGIDGSHIFSQNLAAQSQKL